jgi:hypothetical protein
MHGQVPKLLDIFEAEGGIKLQYTLVQRWQLTVQR